MIEVLDDHGGVHKFDGAGAEWASDDASGELMVKTPDKVTVFAHGKWVYISQGRPT
ncbi:hypothetical protein [Mycolicibacterium fortuitum]|uniref:hypothetical protein n=1 Tax=Mycolicibacterium fortuitum TaxID=1766 RepID=UPI0026357AFC|nr:hypothetical protein [Mycolicibacterium fortuitum]